MPCLINNYTNIEPSYYSFDLSAGYDTGDDPANILKSDQGRTITLILTKTW